MFDLRSTCLALLIAFIGISPVLSDPAAGQTARSDERINFDIPAQPLDAALAEYFRLTGVQLLYDSAVTVGRRSVAIRGPHAPREALRLMLAGSGLVARYSRSNAAIIVPAADRGHRPLVPLGRVVVREAVTAPRVSSLERITYYNLLEEELQTRLRTDERTARLVFRIVVALRVDQDGQLRDVRISRSSGRGATDRLVADVLGGAAVVRPPIGLPQPLMISLKGRRN
jgi:hypothetical protein